MISLKILVFNNYQVNTFVLSDESGEAVIIDPACSDKLEYNELKEYITINNLKPKHIINTHGHIDHIVGVEKIMKHYNIPFGVHADDLFLIHAAKEMGAFLGFEIDILPIPSYYIKEGDVIKFGTSKLEILHIPGHSPGSIIFYSPTDNFAIVGDVLFNGSIGRTDLPGGNYEALIAGIKAKLLTLPPKTIIFSGHGGSTTIQHEHDTNPFLI